MANSPEDAVLNFRELEDLLTRLQDSLTQATNKNNSLLESLETVEARAIDSNSGELSLVRNLRARLSATHLPNAELRKSLPIFSGLFLKRFNDLTTTLECYNKLNIKLQQDNKDIDDHMQHLEKERDAFYKERHVWRKNLEQARKEVTEQNDRLTLLSQQLSGEKNQLEVMNNELANKRIAFEEEKLTRENTVTTNNDEAEILRRKLRDQALSNIHLESSLLHMEVSLHQKEEDIIKCEEKLSRQQQEIQHLRMTSSKAVKQFEKRTQEANTKLSEMNSELSKAQEHAHRFQDLLMTERRKQKALQHALDQTHHVQSKDSINPSAQKAYIETLSQTIQATKPRHPARVEDIARQSECVLVENANLKAEIRKLRIENNDLMKRVKFADANAHYLRNQVVMNLHDRAHQKHLVFLRDKKLKKIHDAFDEQVTEWVSEMEKEKTDHIKSQFREIKPISTLGASERTWNTGPPKTHSLSRSNIQVTKW